MSPDSCDITIEKLIYGGNALGRLPDGRAIFVPYALPGEKVRLQLVEEKQGHVRAELLEVLEASPDRTTPLCLHFFTSSFSKTRTPSGIACGGCHYQHISYGEQLNIKVGILRDQLLRIGRLENPPLTPVIPSADPWNYRNHIQFHLNSEGKLGYQASGSHFVIPISECHLPEPALNSFWSCLDFCPDSGIERASLRLGMEGEVMLVLTGKSPEPPELDVEADISVVHLADDHAVVLAGDDHITAAVLDRRFHVSAASFFQVNTRVAGKMVEFVLASLPDIQNATVMDVYCGVGLFSAFLAPGVKKLVAIETSASACRDFVTNLDEFDNVELYEAPAEDVMPQIDLHPDITLVDPPRTGLDKRVMDAIRAQGPQKVVYVSCDPSTLARDARRLLDGGYRLKQVTPFDLFPQTYHIESISIFER